jgi:hypothetical protein
MIAPVQVKCGLAGETLPPAGEAACAANRFSEGTNPIAAPVSKQTTVINPVVERIADPKARLLSVLHGSLKSFSFLMSLPNQGLISCEVIEFSSGL